MDMVIAKSMGRQMGLDHFCLRLVVIGGMLVNVNQDMDISMIMVIGDQERYILMVQHMW